MPGQVPGAPASVSGCTQPKSRRTRRFTSCHFGQNSPSQLMSRSSRTPGVSRIDQAAKRTHGFFVRLQRRGKTHSAFFTDQKYGGRKRALAAAQKHYRKLLAKWGPPVRNQRRRWAEIRRRKGSSGIVGLQLKRVRRHGEVRKYWVATWSPKPYVSQHKEFSVWRYGSKKARQLAVRARRAGLRNMQ